MGDVRVWQGYDKADIYSAQDDCLIAISNGRPLLTELLQRIPPHRATLLVLIAEKANTGLEKGTYAQFLAESASVTSFEKLGEWWNR